MATVINATSLAKASQIMGENFLHAQAAKKFHTSFLSREYPITAEVPCSADILYEYQNTHILVCVPRLSIIDIHSRVNSGIFFEHDKIWYEQQFFATDRAPAKWYLIRKTAIPGSESLIWDKQILLLSDKETIPPARVMTYAVIAYYLMTGQKLFRNQFVFTSDVDSLAQRVGIGWLKDGIFIRSLWVDNQEDRLGLASMKTLLIAA